MRGTKHDASQHQRRGIRSRLIASVAAVAMLATSIAAGTAVAADIDETDPTQQNTIVEQPQQGAENAGDQTGEQNTEPEGEQPDQPQESDSTETETESDNTAEADVTEETTPKTDAGKTDTNQSSEKQSDAVPAPQAANAADAEVSTQAEGDEDNTNLLTETFYGSDLDESQWQVLGDACMTAADRGGRLSCYRKDIMESTTTQNYHGSSHGNGFLQLTDNAKSSNGTVLNNTPIQTRLGLNVSFYQYQFGDRDQSTLADGIGFFLVDAESGEQIQIGPNGNGVGGALGYSAVVWSNDPNHYNQSTLYEGIANGVLGIGLDTYGNYSNEKEVGGANTRDSGHIGSKSNYVTVRGPGEYVQGCPDTNQLPAGAGRWTTCENSQGGWYNGYNILSQAPARNLLNTGAPGQDYWGTNENGQAGGTLVNIHISTPDESNDGKQLLTVTVGESKLVSVWLDADVLPDVVNFGFSASTGAAKAAHFIRGLEVHTILPTDGIMLTKNVAGQDGHVYSEGETVTYRFTVTNTGNTKLTDVQIVDDKLGGTVTCPSNELEAGKTMVCTGKMELTAKHTASGTFTNIATVTGTTPEGEQVTSTDSEDIPTVPSLGAPEIRKWIEKNDGANDHYTLNLSVKGDRINSSSTTGSETLVDVVFVLDMSDSMNDDRRLQTLKNAITGQGGLSEILYETEGIDAETSVIAFSSGNYVENAGIVRRNIGSKDVLDQVVKGLAADGGTHWQDGLNKVSQIQTRDGAKKYVVFLTDGNPGRNGWNGNSGTDIDDAIKTYNSSVTAGKALAADGWNILNVGVDMPSQEVWVNPSVDKVSRKWHSTGIFSGYYMNNNFTFEESPDWTTPLEALTKREQSAQVDDSQVIQFTDTDSDNLADVFKDLGGTITTKTEKVHSGVVITDDISQWADTVDIQVNGTKVVSGVQVISSNENRDVAGDSSIVKSITLDNGVLTVAFANDYAMPKDVTFTVKFTVKPSAAAYEHYAANVATGKNGDSRYVLDDGTVDKGESDTGTASAGHAGFFSNDEATLSYKECTTTNSGDPQCVNKDDLIYNKPVLQVKSTSMIVTKKWNGGSDHDSVIVHLYDDAKDTGRTLTLQGLDWTGTFDGLIPGHTYTVVEDSVSGYTPSVSYSRGGASVDTGLKVTVSDVWTDPQPELKAMVTNTLQTYEYEVDHHLGLHKKLAGNGAPELEDGMFQFRLEPVKEQEGVLVPVADGDPVSGMALPDETTVGNGDANGNSQLDEDDPSNFDFGTVTFSQEGTYYLRVVELNPDDDDVRAVSGVQYDRHALYIKYVIEDDPNGVPTLAQRWILNADRDEQISPETAVWTKAYTDDSGSSEANESDLTWTNLYVAVSGLPLTGGRSTARTLLLAGGGVLLVAGAAWLLARRRQV